MPGNDSKALLRCLASWCSIQAVTTFSNDKRFPETYGFCALAAHPSPQPFAHFLRQMAQDSPDAC